MTVKKTLNEMVNAVVGSLRQPGVVAIIHTPATRDFVKASIPESTTMDVLDLERIRQQRQSGLETGKAAIITAEQIDINTPPRLSIESDVVIEVRIVAEQVVAQVTKFRGLGNIVAGEVPIQGTVTVSL